MVSAALAELEHVGVRERRRTAVADGGYWHRNQIDSVQEVFSRLVGCAQRAQTITLPGDAREHWVDNPGS